MLSKLLVGETSMQSSEAKKLILGLQLSENHPDLLWIESVDGKKIGVEETKKIREHFSLKPYSAPGRVVVVLGADLLTLDAQNSLLKTLEEPPETGTFILTAGSVDSLLPTIVSRCEIINVASDNGESIMEISSFEIEKMLAMNLEEKFQFIEKTENKEGLLSALGNYVASNLKKNPKLVDFARLTLEAQKWQKAQGNTRAILEYLMLNTPETTK